MLSSKAIEIQSRFNVGWIRIDQLKQYVKLIIISPEEYKVISGEVYTV